MPPRAVVLLSGGLDSILAIRILQEQGIEVDALNFRTVFACCQDSASQVAHRLGVRLSVIGEEDEYLDLIRKPRFGYGRGANPCIDCRIFMFDRARLFMEEIGASMVASGEVVGQRPMSQKRRDLDAIAIESGLEGRLLRPLSAKLLTPTIPEMEGEVDREKLYDFSGRSRKGLIKLAREFGFDDVDIPSPSTGCMLTESSFSTRVHDLIQLDPENSMWDFELLKIGRHLRLNANTKVVVGRQESENAILEYLSTREDNRATALVRPHNFMGPMAILIGPKTEESIEFAGGLVRRFSNSVPEGVCEVEFDQNGEKTICQIDSIESAETAATL